MSIQSYKFNGDGLTNSEKKLGKKLFQEYRETYNIESASDLPLLEELIYREIRQKEIKEQIQVFKTDAKLKNKNTPPKSLISDLDENLEQIITLKEKLGLFKPEETKGIYEYITVLEKKFKTWREENQATRQLICPHCSEMILLTIRTEAYEALKHPHFSDRVLANKHLWKLFKEGTITKLDVAKVLQGEKTSSTDYVDWLEKKIYKNFN